MNIKHTTILLTLATLATVSLAEEKKEFPQRPPAGAQGNEEMRQKMIMKRFDKDGDGQLNEAEKEAAAKAKKELIGKYDKDGDGELNPEERKAFMEDRRKKMGDQGAKGRRGRPMADPAMRKKILEKYDADGDGELNEAERKAAMDDHRKQMEAQNGEDGGKKIMPKELRMDPEQRKMLVEKFDADGDGKLNEDEHAKLQEHLKAKKAE